MRKLFNEPEMEIVYIVDVITDNNEIDTPSNGSDVEI